MGKLNNPHFTAVSIDIPVDDLYNTHKQFPGKSVIIYIIRTYTGRPRDDALVIGMNGESQARQNVSLVDEYKKG